MSAPVERALMAVVALVAAIACGILVRGLALGRLQRLASRTRWRFDDAVVESLRRPLPVWFGLAGAYVALRLADLPAHWESVGDRAISALLVVSLSLWAADLAVRALRLATPKGTAAPTTGVVLNVVRLVVLLVGALMLLGTLGISITPILTTIGVGGLAVALGLQDTLANLFAGVHLTLAGNLRVGDYVRLENGEEGYIDDIKWRSTRTRTLPGNIVVIPNNRLAQSVVTNYHLPSKDMAVLVEVGVHYASDLDRVEAIVQDVARSVLAGHPSVAGFDPFVRYHTFGESSIDFTVILRVGEYVDQYLVKHEFIKLLARRFRDEGIVIPFPIRAVNFAQEASRERDDVRGRLEARPDPRSAAVRATQSPIRAP